MLNNSYGYFEIMHTVSAQFSGAHYICRLDKTETPLKHLWYLPYDLDDGGDDE